MQEGTEEFQNFVHKGRSAGDHFVLADGVNRYGKEWNQQEISRHRNGVQRGVGT